jgi:uncharacterized protein DUF6293
MTTINAETTSLINNYFYLSIFSNMSSLSNNFVSPINPLRIHISPVGFEVDRIILPAFRMKADRVWLITHNNPSADEGIHFLEAIKKELDKEKIEFREEAADRTDLFDTLRAFRSILVRENGNNIMVNVSAGSKIQAIASMLACMMFKNTLNIKPYYVIPEKYTSAPRKQETEGLKDIVSLPEYEIKIPSQKLVRCLTLITDFKGGTISKKQLRDLALQEGLIHVETQNADKEGIAAYMSLNKNFIQPLSDRSLINVEKIGGSHQITLTTEGKNVLKFLR